MAAAPRTQRQLKRSAPPRLQGFRLVVPLALSALALITLVIMALAAAVLLGFIPYPGR